MKNLLCCGSAQPKAKRLRFAPEASSNLRARAVKDYHNVTDAGHISFREGELLTVTEQNPNTGMWKGFRCGAYSGVTTRPGYFPASAVVLLDPHVNDQTGKRKNGTTTSVSELGRQHHRHQTNGIKFVEGNRHGAPPSPIGRTRDGQLEVIGENGSMRTTNSRNTQHSQNQNSYLAVRLPVGGGDNVVGKESPGGGSQVSSASSYQTNCQACSGVLSQQHRLSGQSCESGVSSSSSRQSYHSGSGVNGVGGSSSSQGSLDRLEESGYSSTVNVHELIQQGLTDSEVLQTWLSSLHLEEHLRLFVEAGYDMPTISRMMPEDLTAIGITKPSVRKKLKTEIGRLTIHDGIPDYKPSTLQEWLALLNLSEYFETLSRQGYSDFNSITDIAWEDLEDVGIKKLGHQKKMMLAIDRLRRINGSSRRLSGTGCRPCASTTITPGAVAADSPILSSRYPSRPSTAPAIGTPEVSGHAQSALRGSAVTPTGTSAAYSVPLGGLLNQSTHVDAAIGNYGRHHPPLKHGVQPLNHSSSSEKTNLDEAPSMLSSTTRANGQISSTGVENSGQHRHVVPSTSVMSSRSNHVVAMPARVAVAGRRVDGSDGDLTPTNERKTASGSPVSTSTVSSSSVRENVSTSGPLMATMTSRPSVEVVSLPKPIPLVARTSNGVALTSSSKTPNSVTFCSPLTSVPNGNVRGDWSSGDVNYTNASVKGNPNLRASHQSQVGIVAHSNKTSVSTSAEPDFRFTMQGTLSRKPATSVKIPASGVDVVSPDISRDYNDVCDALSDLLSVGQTMDMDSRLHSRCLPVTTSALPVTSVNDTRPAEVTSTESVERRREPPVPPMRSASFKTDIRAAMLAATDGRLSADVNGGFSASTLTTDGKRPRVTASSSDKDYFVGGVVCSSDNLLNEVIQRLERSGSMTTGSHRNTINTTSGARRLGDWQDSRSSSGSEDSDSGLESRRSESVASVIEACAASGGGSSLALDTNTLPFANENVGTIKQRGQSSSSSASSAKQSTASTCTSTSGVELSPATLSSDDWTNGNTTKITSPSRAMNAESETVFNDIDGILLGLTAELDEMLKLQG